MPNGGWPYRYLGCIILLLSLGSSVVADDSLLELEECLLTNKSLGGGCVRYKGYTRPDDYKVSPNALPRPQPSEPTTVWVSMAFYSLRSLDPKRNTISLSVWLRQAWYDESLTWNPDDYNGRASMGLRADQIWTPEVTLYNAAEKPMANLLEAPLNVYSDGLVFWSQPGIVEMMCSGDTEAASDVSRPGGDEEGNNTLKELIGQHWPSQINLVRFPFDKQFCEFEMGSWLNTAARVNLELGTPPVEPIDGLFVPDLQWEVKPIKAERRVRTYSCCEQPWTLVYFYLRLEREPGNFVRTLVVPIAVAVMIGFLGFLMGNEPDRLTIGFTSLLTVLAVMFIAQEKLPPSSTATMMELYYIGSLIHAVMPLLASGIHILMRRMHDQDKERYERVKDVMDILDDMEEETGRNLARVMRRKNRFTSAALSKQSSVRRKSGSHEDGAMMSEKPPERQGVARRVMPLQRSQTMSTPAVVDVDEKDGTEADVGRLKEQEKWHYEGKKYDTKWSRQAKNFEVLSWKELAYALDGAGFIVLTMSYLIFLALTYGTFAVSARHYALVVTLFVVVDIVCVCALVLIFQATRRWWKSIVMARYEIWRVEGFLDKRDLLGYFQTFRTLDKKARGFVTPNQLRQIYELHGRDAEMEAVFSKLRIDPNDDESRIGFVEFVNTLATNKVMRAMQRELMGATGTWGCTTVSQGLLKRLKAWQWTEEDVRKWMIAQGFPSAASRVHSSGVDGPTLLTLNDFEIRQELGIANLGSRRALLANINSLYGQFIESQTEGS